MDADHAPVSMYERDFGVLDLTPAGFVAQLAHGFDDVKEPAAEPRVAARQEPAVRRHR